jgi:predicted nucleotidyltransferase component of viral defense system
MIKISENKRCYAGEKQRSVLLDLISNKTIEDFFFLTGGTALSVFYLHHRISNDLDLFTINQIDIPEIDYIFKTELKRKYVKIKESGNFLSALIDDTKVDIVIDPLSNKEERNRIIFENNRSLSIDTIKNIVSNKLNAMASRTEPKDFIDFYFLNENLPDIDFNAVYDNAKLKDAIFDDPPTAAFQIEENFNVIKNNPEIIPELLIKMDMDKFFHFHKEIIRQIYKKLIPDQQ